MTFTEVADPDWAPGSHNWRVQGVMNILFGCNDLMIAMIEPDLVESGLVGKLNDILQDLERVWVKELPSTPESRLYWTR